MKNNLYTFLQFINEQHEEFYAPTHEELENLFWFKRILELDPEADWVTGKKAFLNGTRVLSLPSIKLDRYRTVSAEYNFYPKKGTIVKGGNPMKSKLNYSSLEDWNRALRLIWIDNVGHRLDRFNVSENHGKPLPQFRRALGIFLTRQDMEGVIEMIKDRGKLSDFLEKYGFDILYKIAVAMEHPDPSKFNGDHIMLLTTLGLNDLIGDV